jgi:class 3 adenylate cyclase
VTAAIANRTRDLSDACRRVLTWAACIGGRFDLETLSAVSGEPVDVLLPLVDEAIRHRALRAEGQGLEFAQPLIREALYGEIAGPRRGQMHWEIARALIEASGRELDRHVIEISHHLLSAGPAADRESVSKTVRRAADQAMAMCAWADGARYYDAALSVEAEHETLSPEARAELHYRAGQCHYRAANAGPCIEHYSKAVEWSEKAGDVRGLALAQLELARVRVTLAPVAYGTAPDVLAIEDAMERLGDGDPALRGCMLAVLSEVHWTARRPELATAAAGEALEIGRFIADDRLCAEASDALALAQTQTVRLREAGESQRNALEYARSSGDRWTFAETSRRLPLVLCWLGELDEADARAIELVGSADATGDWTGRSMLLASRAAVAVSRGRFADADDFARESLLMSHRSGYPWGAFNALLAQASGQYQRGAWREARETLATVIEPGQLFDEPGPAVHFLVWVYRQLIDVRAKGSSEQLEAGLARIVPEGEPEIGALAAFCATVEIGSLLNAAQLASSPYRLLSLAVDRGVLFSSAWPFLLPRVLGVAATLRGDLIAAEGHFRHALEIGTRTRAEAELGLSHLEFSRMLLRRDAPGDSGRAAHHLDQARPLLERLGMEPFAEQAERLAPRCIAGDRVAEPGNDLDADEYRLLTALAAVRPHGGVEDHTRELDDRLDDALRKISARDERSASDSPVVLLLTDMRGSTEMIDRLGDSDAHEIMLTHDQILRRCLAASGGLEVDHVGDGILAAFASATRAVECATAILSRLERHNRNRQGENQIRVRIGLTAGEPLRSGGRLFGSVVNAVARICARAEAGQILVSEVVAHLAAGKGLSFQELGSFSLKGFEHPVRLHEVDW